MLLQSNAVSHWLGVRANSRLAPSQWETSLQSNAVWLAWHKPRISPEWAYVSSVWQCCNRASQMAAIAGSTLLWSLLQSTPVISRQLGAKIRERELSGSPVISRFHAKAQTSDFQDQSPTLWRLHLLNPNSMLSDNGCTYISRISADVDIAPATNHKPYYILTIMHQKLSNYMLHRRHMMESVLKPYKPRCGFDRKRK